MKMYKAYDTINNCEISFSHESDAIKAKAQGWINSYHEYVYQEPVQTPEELEAMRGAALEAQLAQLDLQLIRPMAAILFGTADAQDHARFDELMGQKTVLREELQGGIVVDGKSK